MRQLALGILIGFALALSLSGSTEGLRFEALGGACKQTRDDKGVWWNDAYETNVDLSTGCYQLGVSQTPWKWRGLDLGWRVAYVNFGAISTNSVMAARDEDQPHNPDGSDCDKSTVANCVIRTIGGGTAQGVSFGGVAEKALVDLTLGAEAGLFLYHNHFTLDIYWQDGSYMQRWDHARGWLLHPYLGLNLRHKWLVASVRQYTKLTAHKSDCGGCSGIANGPAWQVSLGLSVPL